MSSESVDSNRRLIAKDVLIGCSLVNLLYIDVWRLLFAATTPFAFFLTVGRTHYVAALATVLVGGIALAGCAHVVRVSPAPLKVLVRLAFLATTFVVLDMMRKSSGLSPATLVRARDILVSDVGRVGMLGLGVVALAVVVRFSAPLTRGYRFVLLLFSPFVVLNTVRTPWLLATVDFDAFKDLARPTHTNVTPAHRVVMVIFDELDNEYAFTRRPAGLSLPNFDSLYNSSVSFDSVTSPGPNTKESMTAYLLGQRVDSVILKDPDTFIAVLNDGRHVDSDTAASIFTPIAAEGRRTALLGFSIPYCRLKLTKMVDLCEWVPLVSGASIGGAQRGIFHIIWLQMKSLSPFNNRIDYIHRVQADMNRAVQLASDSSYSFVFIHIPLPHMPAIFDRVSDSFKPNITSADGYLGNLVLADRLVGRMHAAMQQSGVWESTNLIVTADHPLREKFLTGTSTDRRIPLIINLPGVQPPSRVALPVNSLILDDLLPSFLAGQILSARALDSVVHGIVRRDSTRTFRAGNSVQPAPK